jgi:hypothetical protein
MRINLASVLEQVTGNARLKGQQLARGCCPPFQ